MIKPLPKVGDLIEVLSPRIKQPIRRVTHATKSGAVFVDNGGMEIIAWSWIFWPPPSGPRCWEYGDPPGELWS